MRIVAYFAKKTGRIRLLHCVLSVWVHSTIADLRTRETYLLQQTATEMGMRIALAEETKAQLESDLNERSARAEELADENEKLEEQLFHLEGLEGQLHTLERQLSSTSDAMHDNGPHADGRYVQMR
eukprot:SAG31_NODE_2273_length_6037_cov_11.461862_2_plen_126_part_00